MPEIYDPFSRSIYKHKNNSHAKAWIPFNFYYGRMRRDGMET